MDKRIAALLGAAAAVATVGGAQAATQPNSPEALHASSYGDLLAPVPNAMQELKADNATRAQMPAEEGVKLAQAHHHHHHHTVVIKHSRDNHHHHHHHHHGAFIGIPGVAGVTVGNGDNHHHHHHHHDESHD